MKNYRNDLSAVRNYRNDSSAVRPAKTVIPAQAGIHSTTGDELRLCGSDDPVHATVRMWLASLSRYRLAISVSAFTKQILTALILSASPIAFAQQAASEPDPTVFQVQGGDTIQTAKLPEDIYLRDPNDPNDIIWNRIPVYRTFLTAAPPVHRSSELNFDPTLGVPLYFQLARTSENFYVRMRWQDGSRNLDTTPSKFRDGVAIQMALNGVDTSYMMGTGPENPVNIWYWRSDKEIIENLAAGGYGSTTMLPEQPVTGKAVYYSDQNPDVREWQVVMSRSIDSDGEYDVALDDGTVPIAFAVWQGEEGQRDGVKRVSHGWIMANVAPATPASHPPSGSAQKPGEPVVLDDGQGPHPSEPSTIDPAKIPKAGETM